MAHVTAVLDAARVLVIGYGTCSQYRSSVILVSVAFLTSIDTTHKLDSLFQRYAVYVVSHLLITSAIIR